jgi:protein-tyrosine-phosphatase
MADVARPRASTGSARRRTNPQIFRVAFVCSANRFRSPLSEAIFRRAAPGVPLVTTSVGITTRSGMRALPQALAEGARHGVDLSAHRTRNIGRIDLRACDLVIGFERAHLAVAVTEARARPERAFTLPALVELIPKGRSWSIDDPVERARHALALASARAASVHLIGGPEIDDPVGKPERAARQVASEVARLTTQLAALLFDTRPKERAAMAAEPRSGIFARYLAKSRK